MQTLRKYIKVVSAFLLINFLFSSFLPTISYALTAGPTAPEATSFEPVDTTDMVNLQTGDFTYNIPLLEVPGPSGGYPISLSYHAGIMPSEEASWVGLGWTLNPGAINRTVNGFADDHRDVTSTNRFFWKGGERTSVEIGLTYGISGTCGMTAGISVGHDTYLGYGVGAFAGVSFGVSGTPLSTNVRVGVDPWGNPNASIGLGAGTGGAANEGMQLSGSVGISTNFKTVSGYSGVGVSYGYGNNEDEKSRGASNLMGASISTFSGGSASLSITGASVTGNSKTGNISTSGFGFVLPVPFLHLGFRNQRYWIDETENTSIYGTLHYPSAAQPDWHYYDDKAFDTYTLLDTKEEGGIVENPDSEKVLGGSFPNYDHYSVNAQGVTGYIQPHIFKGYLHRQNAKEGDKYKTIHYSNGVHDKQLGFRFVGDFSNRYVFNPPNFSNGDDLLNFDFEEAASEVTGYGEIAGMSNGKLAGSKNIEYLTNFEIKSKASKLDEIGFMDTSSSGFSRLPSSQSTNSQIGAYVVTNESGVKYHFSLPVYASEEYQYSENINGVTTFNEFKKPMKYAYTWLLTGITGPDFVDRGVIGQFDEEDWGYWVEFDYGKWTEDYVWRNPDLGTHKDLDTNFENFSTGIKEVYYLDRIKTKTHTAVFVKDIRDDAKSAIRHFKNKYGVPTTEDEKEGSYKPKMINTKIRPSYFGVDAVSIDTRSLPVSSLKLKEIYLFKNQDLMDLDKTEGNQWGQQMTYDWTLVSNDLTGERVVSQHLPDNVLDAYDLTEDFGNKAIRVIGINSTNKSTEDALCPETINSYATSLVNTSAFTIPLQGKLTLQSIDFKGKGGANLIPPIKFDYELDNPIYGQSKIVREGATCYLMETQSGLEKGDIIKLSTGETNYYALIQNDLGFKHKLKILGRNQLADQTQVSWVQTNNPPYDAEAHDIWGMYKSNYYKHGKNENLARLTSNISSESADVWSLCSIKTSYGNEVKIEYEIDEYQKPELYNQSLLTVDKIEVGSDPNTLKVFVYEDISNYNDILENLSLEITLLIYKKQFSVPASSYPTNCGVFSWVNHVFNIDSYFVENSNVLSVNDDFYLKIEDEELFELLSEEGDKVIGSYMDTPCIGSNETVLMVEVESENDVIQGNIFVNGNINTLGGGLRTKKIAVFDPLKSIKNNTNYRYEKGVTSYEPTALGVIDLSKLSALKSATSGNLDAFDDAAKEFKKAVYNNFDLLLANSREIPSPGVVYGRVTVQESHTDSDGNEHFTPTYSTYEFQTFEDYMVDIYPEEFSDQEVTPSATLSSDATDYTDKVRKRKVTISDLTAQVGALKSITRYENINHDGDQTNDQMITKTINHHLYDEFKSTLENVDITDGNGKGQPLDPYAMLSNEMEERFSSQGILHESFVDARYVRQEDYTIEVKDYNVGGVPYHNIDVNPYHLLGVVSKKERFPLIQTGQTNINYKTGVTTKTTNLGFDFYSGAVTKTLSSDSYGNIYLSETIPAYRKYGGMGLAINGGKNMLTQTAANYAWKLNNMGDVETLISSSIQTWNDQVASLTPNFESATVISAYFPDSGGFKSILRGTKSFYEDGQLIEFSFEGTTYTLQLGEWSDNYIGFEIVNLGDLIVDDGNSFVGQAKYYGSDIWRKHKSYTYTADRLNERTGLDGFVYDTQNLTAFDAWTPEDGEPDAMWQKTSEITLYDRYSHALEATDINGNYAATKMDSKQEKVLATVANASYDEFAYSGAEDENVGGYQGGAVKIESSFISSSEAHTGDKSVGVFSGQKAFSFEGKSTSDRVFKVSFWSDVNKGKVKYQFGTEEFTVENPDIRMAGQDGWYQISANITIPNGQSFEIWCEGDYKNQSFFDDFRVHPIDAPMTSYVYNEYDELTHVLDNNNLYTKYQYDAMGRLSSTYRESFKYGCKKVSEYDITYSVSAKKQ